MLVRIGLSLGFLSVTCAILGLNIRGNAQWFQNLNNLGLNINSNINNNNNNRIRDTFMNGVLRGRNSACSGTGTSARLEGLCKPNKECRLEGGTPSGSCALVGSCCIQSRTCGNTTSSRVAYFTNPLDIQPTCGLNIRLTNRRVCQIRLDFELFSIAEPAGATQPSPVHNCIDDAFTVMGASVSDLGFQALCGINNGQHIYLPVNGTTGNGVMLNFALRQNRTAVVASPTWRIKITQLECEGLAQDFSSVQSALTTLYENHQNKKSNVRTDPGLIAPPGCLQYHPQATGTYESFNYNNGLGTMIANTNYAICFRRQMTTCGIQHASGSSAFSMSDQGDSNLPCRSAVGDGDWLYIPGVSVNPIGTTASIHQDYLCGIDLDIGTAPVVSTGSGPLFVGVRTDNIDESTSQSQFSAIGFRITYSTLTTGCNPTIATVAPPPAGP